MYITQEIASRIKATAKERKKPLSQLSAECNININAISEFAKGKQLSCITLAKIADNLNVSVDYLLGRSNEPDMITSINTNTVVKAPQFNVANVGSNSNAEPSHDEMTTELVKAFKSLSFKDKMEIMNAVMKKSQK